jgi:hypothetical protein
MKAANISHNRHIARFSTWALLHGVSKSAVVSGGFVSQGCKAYCAEVS